MEKCELALFIDKAKRSAMLLLAFMMSFVMSACTEMTKINLGKEGIIYCSNGNPESFNPQLSTSDTTTDASSYP